MNMEFKVVSKLQNSSGNIIALSSVSTSNDGINDASFNLNVSQAIFDSVEYDDIVDLTMAKRVE